MDEDVKPAQAHLLKQHAAIPCATTIPDNEVAYDSHLESMRIEQFPMLKNTLFLDNAGTTLPNKRLLDTIHYELSNNLYGNPHSASSSSQRSLRQIEQARFGLLRLFNANPDEYDIVFTANATASIKLVGDALRDLDGGFSYAYHVASHTSIVGMRGLARDSRCLTTELEMRDWVAKERGQGVALFAYPAQSNMDGSRLPLSWCRELRQSGVYSMLDAAAHVSTTPLDLSIVKADFTVVSLYKIFGMPDLGALIVKKSAAHLFDRRKYFGGGTVDMVVCSQEPWHVCKASLYERLEDGTLPIHNIVALNSALRTFDELFGSLKRVSEHTQYLARLLHKGMLDLRHANSKPVCDIYSSVADDTLTQGPIVAFNLLDQDGTYVSTMEVDKLAAVKNIQLRTGSLCNPGGTAMALHLSPSDLRQNYLQGYRCGSGNGLINGKSTGVVRVSFGAFNTSGDVDCFLAFLQEYFTTVSLPADCGLPLPSSQEDTQQLQVESLTIYPIKSCAGWSVPYDRPWQVHREGLAWDREWCIVQAGTGKALSQKQYPKMALIRPVIDLRSDSLHIQLTGDSRSIKVPLRLSSSSFDAGLFNQCSTGVCEDIIEAQRYTSTMIAEILSSYLGVACTLARFPAASSGQQSHRHSKDHLRTATSGIRSPLPLLLSNESPILTITRSSLDSVNESLKGRNKRAAHHSVFRANIILAELPALPPGTSHPWEEDHWQTLRVQHGTDAAPLTLESLGGCRRCQMVCVDQQTGENRPEVFLTLANQRRLAGKVLFGIHCAPLGERPGLIQVGDIVTVSI